MYSSSTYFAQYEEYGIQLPEFIEIGNKSAINAKVGDKSAINNNELI